MRVSVICEGWYVRSEGTAPIMGGSDAKRYARKISGSKVTAGSVDVTQL
jgi:hypothetical protein